MSHRHKVMRSNALVGITLLRTPECQLLVRCHQLIVSIGGAPVFSQSARMLEERPFVGPNRLGMFAYRVAVDFDECFQTLHFTQG